MEYYAMICKNMVNAQYGNIWKDMETIRNNPE